MKTLKKDLIQSYQAASDDALYTSWALQCVMDKEVAWLTEKGIKAGICRADSASGGIVIIQNRNIMQFPRVYLLEKWVHEINISDAPRDTSGEYYQEWLNLRELARRVMICRNDLLNGGKI